MIAVTQWVAALPGAIGRMAAFGIGPLIAASIGIILLGLLRTPLRWAGAAALAGGGGLGAGDTAAGYPDLRRRPHGRRPRPGWAAASDRECQGQGAKDSFLLREWLAADADGGWRPIPRSSQGVSCDDAGCVAQLADGGLVALALRPDALADDCERAALLVTARPAPAACGALVVDQDRLRRQGALALRRARDGFAVDAVKPRGVDRPWSPAVADGAESEASLTRPAAPRAVDATPSEADLQAEE